MKLKTNSASVAFFSTLLGAMGLLAAFMGQAAAAEKDTAGQRDAAAVFESLKTWVGRWEATTPDGKKAWKTDRLAANGTVLVEEYAVEGQEQEAMYTLYHLDGEDLVLTHYCMVGNQPRMKASWGDSKSSVVSFDFVGATNLADPNEGHMHRAVFEMLDPDRIKESWTFFKDGREAFTEVLEYHRTR